MSYVGCETCGKTKRAGEPCPHCQPGAVTAAGTTAAPVFEKVICTSCGVAAASGRKVAKGSFLIEVILWLCFLIPGLIYSIWRISNKQTVCRSCGQATVIPIDSPMAKALRANLAPRA